MAAHEARADFLAGELVEEFMLYKRSAPAGWRRILNFDSAERTTESSKKTILGSMRLLCPMRHKLCSVGLEWLFIVGSFR
jgi:hypothetical protein